MENMRKTLDEALANNRTVLVEFYADWCPHCQRMMPIVEQLRRNLPADTAIVQIEERNEALMHQYNVQSFPTWILFEDGRQVHRSTGEMTLNDLRDMITYVDVRN